jgi:hypothetical protein
VLKFLSIAALLLLSACNSGRPVTAAESPALRAPSFDADFRRLWDDGSAEVASYQTLRLRQGVLLKGAATVVMRRDTYSEDERVPVGAAKRAQPDDLFPAFQMNWLERYAAGAQNCAEMTTSVVALTSVDGRVSGAETKADFSFQGWDGQLFHQLIFDASGIRSHQYSYFESEGDEQITLPYPRDGVPGDVLWFWARGLAAPALNPGEQRAVMTIPALRDAREQHHALTWRRLTLSRGKDSTLLSGAPAGTYSAHADDGSSETFVVEQALPFRVLHWENSAGERADFVSASRMKSWEAKPR